MVKYARPFISCSLLLAMILAHVSFGKEIRGLTGIYQQSFDDKLINGNNLLRSVDGVKRKMDCMLQCGTVENCVFLTYNIVTRQCRLFASSLFSPHDTENSTGWRAYRFGDPQCPLHLGFIYSREYHMCIMYTIMKYEYQRSRQFCKSLGAEHVALDADDRKRQALRKILKITTQWMSMWISAKYIQGRWELDNGEPLDGIAWQDFQPQCPTGPSCNCLVLQGANDWRIKVDVCTEKHLVVCEYAIN